MILAVAVGGFGYLNGRVSWAGRALVTAAAGFLLFPTIATDLIGFALAVSFFGPARRTACPTGGRAIS